MSLFFPFLEEKSFLNRDSTVYLLFYLLRLCLFTLCNYRLISAHNQYFEEKYNFDAYRRMSVILNSRVISTT